MDTNNSSEVKESYNCSCYTGWRGQNCTEDVNECDENIGMMIYYLDIRGRLFEGRLA